MDPVPRQCGGDEDGGVGRRMRDVVAGAGCPGSGILDRGAFGCAAPPRSGEGEPATGGISEQSRSRGSPIDYPYLILKVKTYFLSMSNNYF